MIQGLTRRRLLWGACTVAGAALARRHARAQSYPSRPVRLVVGGAAGSVPDMVARLVGDRLAGALGQSVVIDNRPSAGGIIAMEALVASAPDGYTVALATMSQAVFNRYLFATLPYDPLRDLAPVATLASGGLTLVVPRALPAHSFAEFLALARARPGKLFVGTAALGSPPHIAVELLMRATGIEATVVPFKSGPEGVTSVLRGDLQAFVDGTPIVIQHVRSGALEALLVTGRAREAQLPAVPTVAELGFPDAESEFWIGLVAPARTPPEIVSQLNRALAAVLTNPELVDRLATLSFAPLVKRPEEFAALIRDDHRRWGPIIREAGIKLE